MRLFIPILISKHGSPFSKFSENDQFATACRTKKEAVKALYDFIIDDRIDSLMYAYSDYEGYSEDDGEHI